MIDSRDFSEGMKGDKRGVSPVVASILLIAITVIAVSALVAYLSAMGELPERPNVRLTVEAWDNDKYAQPAGENDYLKIRHRGGDALLTRELKVWIKYRGPGPEGIPCLLSGKFSKAMIKVGEEATVETDMEGGDYYNIKARDLVRVWIVHAPSKTYIYDDQILAENALA